MTDFKANIINKLSSRKLWMSIIAGIIAVVTTYDPTAPAESIKYLLYCLMGYVGVEGLVDAAGAIGKWLLAKNITENNIEVTKNTLPE